MIYISTIDQKKISKFVTMTDGVSKISKRIRRDLLPKLDRAESPERAGHEPYVVSDSNFEGLVPVSLAQCNQGVALHYTAFVKLVQVSDLALQPEDIRNLCVNVPVGFHPPPTDKLNLQDYRWNRLTGQFVHNDSTELPGPFLLDDLHLHQDIVNFSKRVQPFTLRGRLSPHCLVPIKVEESSGVSEHNLKWFDESLNKWSSKAPIVVHSARNLPLHECHVFVKGNPTRNHPPERKHCILGDGWDASCGGYYDPFSQKLRALNPDKIDREKFEICEPEIAILQGRPCSASSFVGMLQAKLEHSAKGVKQVRMLPGVTIEHNAIGTVVWFPRLARISISLSFGPEILVLNFFPLSGKLIMVGLSSNLLLVRDQILSHFKLYLRCNLLDLPLDIEALMTDFYGTVSDFPKEVWHSVDTLVCLIFHVRGGKMRKWSSMLGLNPSTGNSTKLLPWSHAKLYDLRKAVVQSLYP